MLITMYDHRIFQLNGQLVIHLPKQVEGLSRATPVMEANYNKSVHDALPIQLADRRPYCECACFVPLDPLQPFVMEVPPHRLINAVAQRRTDRESEVMDGRHRRTGPGACPGFTRLVHVEIPWLATEAGNDGRDARNGPANHGARMKNPRPAAS